MGPLGPSQPMFTRKRPHLDLFLQTVSRHFEVIVFTAAERGYAERVLRFLDPEAKLIDYVLCREDCLQVTVDDQTEYIKDLNVLGRDLAHLVLVDNRPEMYGFQVILYPNPSKP